MDKTKNITRNSLFFVDRPKKFFSNLFQKTQTWIQDHRKVNRIKLLQKPINTATLISVVPFLLGFSNFIDQKYPVSQKNLFFEKNLPGINLPSQKVHWDTFEYLVKKINPKFWNSHNIIHWSDQNLNIQTIDISKVIRSPETNLISHVFIPLKSKSNQLNSKFYTFQVSGENLAPINNFYQHLDDLPIKLQGNSNFSSQYTSTNFYHKLILNLNFISNIEINRFSPKNVNLKNFSFQPQILVAVNSKNKIINKNVSGFLESVQNNKNCLISWQKSHEFHTKRLIYNQELLNLFNTTGFIPTLNRSNSTKNFNLYKISKGTLSKNEDLQTLQEIIRKIDQINLSFPLAFTRLMSGYKYPDMNLVEVRSLLTWKQQSNISKLQISLPASYALVQSRNIEPYPPPQFLIQSKKLILKDSSGREIFYEGPAILFDQKNGFDWKTIERNSKNPTLRVWLTTNLDSQNPLSDRLKNFFGIFESPSNSTKLETEKRTKNEQSYWLKNLSVFKNGIIAKTSDSFIPFERSFQLPFLKSTDWREEGRQNYDVDYGISNQYTTVLLPITEIRIPTFQLAKTSFGLKPYIDFEFLHPLKDHTHLPSFKLISKNVFQSNFIATNSHFSEPESFQTNLNSGIYKKTLSLFTDSSQIGFTDLWEPLTFKSWLVTCQIGFAFLVFQILKALADNYGRELLVYLLDLVALLGFLDDDLKQEIEILMGQKEKGFRIITKTTKNFNDIGGIETLLPEVVEIVWFLRNSGREFSISKTLPRGVLLTGPPGTGKTLLVQAIAGEAEVPVLALSGSSLLEPGESGALKLEILFQEARKLAPCIVFIDEIDTLAQKREQVLQNPMGADEIIESLSNIPLIQSKIESTFLDNKFKFADLNEINDVIFTQQDLHKEKLRILMQFLVELDGIQSRDGVIVIGATNRSEILDPAILRPGRFDRIFELGLPGPEKRKEILKLYSLNLGIEKNIAWNYLIHRTSGYSAADLASIMNQSTLYAILTKTHHTVKTIEHGIDRITTIGFEKSITSSKNYIGPIQVAYYQAGKILLSTLLKYHPPILVSHLWPRRPNVRAVQISQNLQKYFFRFARRIELEHRIIGSYAGKAAEILFIQDSAFEINLSDFGLEDIQFGQNLIKSMIQNWYFYSKNISIYKNTNILKFFNLKEYRNLQDKIPFFNSLLDNLDISLGDTINQFGTNVESNIFNDQSILIEQQAQQYFPSAKFQHQVSNEFELATRTFSNWYRLYLPDPQQTERNLEWIPADEFYHGNTLGQQLSNSITWNNLGKIQIDYEMHSLILQSFNKAVLLLDQNREVLDKLAYELLHREILREPEIELILSQFGLETKMYQNTKNLPTQFEQLYKDWGSNSRRKKSRWIDFKRIKKSKL